MVSSTQPWPEWWEWELDCANPHLAKRMADRGFDETDLRDMLERATGFNPDHIPGRWLIHTTHADRPWDVVVEPDAEVQSLVVVTAYAVEPHA